MAQNLPPPGTRSRGASNASANRYVPEDYPQQPPYAGPEQGYRPPRSCGPSFNGQQIPYNMNPQPYGPGPDVQAGQYQRQPSYSENVSGGRLRPPAEPRRHSASSTHSRRSHDSRRSHRSKRSSSPDDRDRHSHDRDRERKHHRSDRHHRKDDERDLKPLKRTDTHRPSWGDTIYKLFDLVRDSLGSSDRR